MSAYKKDIAKATMTILLVALVSIASYYFFPESLPHSPFAFAFIETSEPFPDLDLPLGESVVIPVLLNTEFSFSNGSSIYLPYRHGERPAPPDPFNWTYYINRILAPSYQGEFNGTFLREIQVSCSGKGPTGATVSSDVSYNITFVRHTIFNTSLRMGEDITDLGVNGWWDSDFLYRKGLRGGGKGLWGHADYEIGPTGRTGYWGLGGYWTVTADQLSSLLQGSGTAILEFKGTISWDIDYELATTSSNETGGETISWEGTLGVIEITYDQGTMLWVKYDFTAIVLLMLPIQV